MKEQVVPRGFRFAAAASGMRFTGRDDVALIACDEPARWAGMFTTSSAAGAPVALNRERLAAGGTARAVLVNAGIANAGTGEAGLHDARAAARLAAEALGIAPEEVLCASTGWIGERLDLDALAAAVPHLVAGLASDRHRDAARAILTSDSVPKLALAGCTVGGVPVRLLGIAKGSGMVGPRMATMLAFLVTDAACGRELLQAALEEAVDVGFNALSIDDEMSTSDMVLLLASGAAGNEPMSAEHPQSAGFRAALRALVEDLTRQLARDGEGATKLVRMTVSGAASRDEARRAAAGMGRSSLLRASIAGAAPAWGRVVAALGASGVPFVLERFSLRVGDTWLLREGVHQGAAAEAAVRAHLGGDEVHLLAEIGRGSDEFTFYTCDLTPQYCVENVNPSLPEPPAEPPR